MSAASGSKRKAAASGSRSSGSQGKKVKATSSTEVDASIPLGKALASTEKRTRDAAVRSLTAYLAANGAHTIDPLELSKLWKGLFYCFWMSDKPLVQQRLANDLANLVLVHPQGEASSQRAQAGLTFLETFWDTLVAEWPGLDKHRIDKFYLLVRRFVAAGFRLLAEEKWETKAVHTFGSMLTKFPGGALSTNDPKVPDSLTYHLSDIYLDELEKVIEQQHEDERQGEQEDGVEEEDDLPLVPTLQLLMPFIDALATAKSKAMYDRIWSNVFEPLLQDTLRASARDDQDDLEEDDDEEEEEEDDVSPVEEEEDDEEDGDETNAGTEFHSFADESTLTPAEDDDDESEPELAGSDSEDGSDDDDESDVRYPLLLALSSVPIPSDEAEMEAEADELDVALVLRKAIFQALFTAASRKDATEARRRLLYQLWRDEQDRLNDA